jgi:hypothetical protein
MRNKQEELLLELYYAQAEVMMKQFHESIEFFKNDCPSNFGLQELKYNDEYECTGKCFECWRSALNQKYRKENE